MLRIRAKWCPLRRRQRVDYVKVALGMTIADVPTSVGKSDDCVIESIVVDRAYRNRR
jgi:hypothetical protein